MDAFFSLMSASIDRQELRDNGKKYTRREFLKLGGVGLGVLAAAGESPQPSSPHTPTNIVRLPVILVDSYGQEGGEAGIFVSPPREVLPRFAQNQSISELSVIRLAQPANGNHFLGIVISHDGPIYRMDVIGLDASGEQTSFVQHLRAAGMWIGEVSEAIDATGRYLAITNTIIVGMRDQGDVKKVSLTVVNLQTGQVMTASVDEVNDWNQRLSSVVSISDDSFLSLWTQSGIHGENSKIIGRPFAVQNGQIQFDDKNSYFTDVAGAQLGPKMIEGADGVINVLFSQETPTGVALAQGKLDTATLKEIARPEILAQVADVDLMLPQAIHANGDLVWAAQGFANRGLRGLVYWGSTGNSGKKTYLLGSENYRPDIALVGRQPIIVSASRIREVLGRGIDANVIDPVAGSIKGHAVIAPNTGRLQTNPLIHSFGSEALVFNLEDRKIGVQAVQRPVVRTLTPQGINP